MLPSTLDFLPSTLDFLPLTLEVRQLDTLKGKMGEKIRALTLGRRHSTLNKRTPLKQAYCLHCFPRLCPFVLLPIAVRQLCHLHEVRAKISDYLPWSQRFFLFFIVLVGAAREP